MTRAERIAQKERNRARWLRIMKRWSAAKDKVWLAQTVARAANHGVLCSCYMCGNKRKLEGPTIQERRHSQSDRGNDHG